MKFVKAHNFFAVLRGLLLLVAGGYFLVKTTAPAIYTLIDNIVGNSYDGGVFILALAISYCINLSVAATITVIYSVCVFGSVKRVKRGVGRGFIAIDVLGNIFAIVLAVLSYDYYNETLLVLDGCDYLTVLALLGVALIGFVCEILAIAAVGRVRGDNVFTEAVPKVNRLRNGVAAVGLCASVVPAFYYSLFITLFCRMTNRFEVTIAETVLLIASSVAVLALVVAATASCKGKGNFSAIVLAVSALALGISGALAFNGVDGSGYVYMAAICAGALMLILSSFFLIAGNVKRKREEQERQRRLIERERADRMRARRAYGYR